MNVIAKTRSFQRRKPALLPQATGSAETFVRYVTAQAHAQLLRVDPLKVANSRWPADKSVRDVIRAVSEPPADLSNTPALAVVATDFVESLKAISASAQLMSNGLLLSFDRNAEIVLPDFTDLDQLPTAFVGPGQPAPVAEMTTQATTLRPHTIEVIVTATKETILGVNADRLIGDALKRQAAFQLDKVLFDAHPGDATRPPGLRASARLAESVSVDNFTAMMQDVGRLVGAAEHIAALSPFFFIARARRIQAMRTMMKTVAPNLTLLPSAASQALPESALLCVVPLAFASAVGLPEVELVEHATLEMNSTPGSPDLAQAQGVRSLFQTDTVAIKLRIPASWAVRNPAGANWLTAIWPSDIGGGGEGMPEAPFDEFHYGRHQGNWHPVVEDAPATPPSQGWVRASFGAPGGWYPLPDLIQHLAPLNSPAFTGAPTAPHPPDGDASTRLATTQFVRDNAGSGGGGGIEDVPAAPNGAFARMRTGATASWVDFATLRVASLDNPVFANGSTGAMGIGIGDGQTGFYRSGNVVVASVSGQATMQLMQGLAAFFVPLNVADPTMDGDAVNRRAGDARYLQKSAGGAQSLTDTLITARGSGPTFPGLAIGDNATGFYREADGSLVISAVGYPIMGFASDRSAVIAGPLTVAGALGVSGSRIIGVADATAADDALNRRSADARYIQATGGRMSGPLAIDYAPLLATDAVSKTYVDQAVLAAGQRAPAFVYDLPADVEIAATGAWVELTRVPFTIPSRVGSSMIMVTLNCNLAGVDNVHGVGARIGPGLPERSIFAFGAGAAGESAGFTANLYSPVSGTTMNIPIELRVFNIGAPPKAITVLGGSGPTRSQITVIDLGPA